MTFPVIVCGSRDYRDANRIHEVLIKVREKHPDLEVVHGGADGADRLAGVWACAQGLPRHAYAVDHDIDGPWPGAGPRRNGRMIRDSGAKAVVAFPGGAGTADCIRQARAAGLSVMVVKP